MPINLPLGSIMKKKKIHIIFKFSSYIYIYIYIFKSKKSNQTKTKRKFNSKMKAKTNTNWVKCIEVNRIIKRFPLAVLYEWTDRCLFSLRRGLDLLYEDSNCFPVTQIKFNTLQNKLRHIYSGRDDTQPSFVYPNNWPISFFYDVLVTRPLYNLYAHAFETARSYSSGEKKNHGSELGKIR